MYDNNEHQQILDKLDKLQDCMTEMLVQQMSQGKDIARNADDIKYHIKRTDLLQEEIRDHIDKDDDRHSAIDARIAKISQPMSFKAVVKNFSMGAAALAGLTTALFYILKLFGKL